LFSNRQHRSDRAVHSQINHRPCNRHSFNPLQPSGYYKYTRFNIKNSLLQTQYVFWMDSWINSSNFFQTMTEWFS
jgi:hypothetical protein